MAYRNELVTDQELNQKASEVIDDWKERFDKLLEDLRIGDLTLHADLNTALEAMQRMITEAMRDLADELTGPHPRVMARCYDLDSLAAMCISIGEPWTFMRFCDTLAESSDGNVSQAFTALAQRVSET